MTEHTSRSLPLRSAYELLKSRGFGAEALALREALPGRELWKRRAKRGMAVEVLRDRGLFDLFVETYWVNGATADGQRRIGLYERHYQHWKEESMTGENSIGNSEWFQEDDFDSDEYQVREYDITASPNDFNVSTMFNFIESGAVKIPGFQRNFVWDLKRASKLIESIIIGLPVPQIFLYEESRNKFLVIDGQQRLMSLYYFVKGRFPRKEKRIELREIFDKQGSIPDAVLQDDQYFVKFNLQLPEQLPDSPNKLNRLNYATLEEHKTTFDLRTIRNVIIKQNLPAEDDSSIFEIFNRLNSGGVNLTPQEIRSSLYHSRFYEALHRLNVNEKWRGLLGLAQPDLHMKDFEIVLRGFAMYLEGGEYRPSMAKFLNRFSQRSKTLTDERIAELSALFLSFLDSCAQLQVKAFYGKATGKFNILLFEAVFAAQCGALSSGVGGAIDPAKLERLKEDPKFVEATQKSTTDRANVLLRLSRAKDILLS